MKYSWLYALLILCSSAVNALDYAPWYSPVLEFDAYAEYCYQHYKRLDVARECESRGETCQFFTLGLDVSPWMLWNTQAEFSLAQTNHKRSLYAKDFQFMGRYLFLDDVVGDPVSFSAGLTLLGFSEAARHDVGVIAQGSIAGEAHIAVGKECAPKAFWLARTWVVGGAGIGNVGSAWLRADAGIEANYYDFWSNALLVNTRWGLGHDALCPEYFHGYGKIRYQFVDLGWKSEMRDCIGTFTWGVFYRVFARNCPKNTLQLLFAFERNLY